MYTFKNTIFFILLKNELFLYIQENVDTNTVFDLTCHHIKTKVGQFFFIATLGQLLQIRKRFLQIRFTNYCMTHSLKSFRIRSYSGLYFPALELNTERYGVSLRIQSECRKIRTRITPNTYVLHAVTTFTMVGYEENFQKKKQKEKSQNIFAAFSAY